MNLFRPSGRMFQMAPRMTVSSLNLLGAGFKSKRFYSTGTTPYRYLTTVDEAETALKADKFVIIDFYADWCAPCKMIAPTFEKLAIENPGAKYYKIDGDKSPELFEKFEVYKIPTIQFFKNSEKTYLIEGANPKLLMDKVPLFVEDKDLV